MRFKKSLVAIAATALLSVGCDDGASGGPTQDDGGAGGTGGTSMDMGGTGGGAGGAGGMVEPDMAVVEPDMAVVEPDMAVVEPDMAVVEADMGGDPPPVMGEFHGGHITALSIALDPAAAGCRDLTGDGVPDNSLGLAAVANDTIQASIDEGNLVMLPSSIGLEAPGLDGAFSLALFAGSADGAGFAVDAASVNPDGSPLIAFPTQADGGTISAGPGNFPVTIPVGEMELVLDINNTAIAGSAGIDGAGFFINNGVISGVIPHDDLVAALANTDYADLVGLVPIDVDGTGHSICLTFTSVGATITNFPIE